MESDTYTPLLNISVIPQVKYRLAPAIWKKLYPNMNQSFYSSSRTTNFYTRQVITSLLVILTLLVNRIMSKVS